MDYGKCVKSLSTRILVLRDLTHFPQPETLQVFPSEFEEMGFWGLRYIQRISVYVKDIYVLIFLVKTTSVCIHQRGSRHVV